MRKTSRMPSASDVSVRQRLLMCATKLFVQKGYTATTVREIVEAAGVTKPVLYYYFQSKEGIYLELIRDAYTHFSALLDSSQGQRGSTKERLLLLSDQLFSLFMEKIDVAKLMYAIYYGPPQGAPFFDFDSYHFKFQDVVRQLVKEGIRNGELRSENAEDMMWAVIGVISVVMEVQLCHPEMGMEQRRPSRILKLIFRGISSKRGQPEGKQK